MAMFSKGLFGAPMMGDNRASPGAGMVQQDATVPSYKKPSTGQMIAGVLGDTLAQWGGGQGTFLPGLQKRQELAEQAALYQRKRADDFTDWQQRQEYEAAHPKAQEPVALQRNYEFLERQSPGLGATYATNYAQNGGGMPQITNIPGVGMVSIPRSPVAGMGGAPSQVPDGAVSMLKQNPGMAAQFDAKYGAGASARYLGGAAPGAGSPFPIR